MSRQNLESNRLTATHMARGSFGWIRRVISADLQLQEETDPILQFIDPGTADRNVKLPQLTENGRLFIICNSSGGRNLGILNPSNVSLGVAAPGSGAIFAGSPQEWRLVGEIGGSAIQGIISGDNSIIAAVVGTNFDLQVDETHVDHDALHNFVANKHIDHSLVSFLPGVGMNGGGDLTASRTLSYDPTNATAATPALVDTIAFFSSGAAAVRKSTFTGLNGVLDHNALLNFVANKHIDHSLVTINGTSGLTGGGDITASRNISLNINGLSTSTTPAQTDFIPFWSVGNADNEKMTLTTLRGALSASLTKTDDTNVTLTLGGSPTTALLQAVSLTLGWTGQLAVTRGGSGLGTAALGDIRYGSGTNTLAALAGNTTTTKKFLSQTGTGAVSAAPGWTALVAGDIPATLNATTVNGLTSGQNTKITGTITPTALAADVNDYNPTGLATATYIRQDGGAADRNITGLTAQPDGTIIIFQNIGTTNSLIFKNGSASSLAANRFTLGADLTLTSQQAIMLRYDGTSSTWRCIAIYTSSAAASGPPVGSIEWMTTNRVPANYIKANGASLSRASFPSLLSAIIASSTVTISIASPGVVTWNNHGLSANDPVKFFTTGALPTGLTAGTHGLVTAGTVYYVVGASITTNTFQVSTTPGGAAVNTSGTQSGTQTAVVAPWGDGDGSTTFTAPNLLGKFPRAWDDGAGVDSNRSFGSAQTDAMQGHFHGGIFGAANAGNNWGVTGTGPAVFADHQNNGNSTGPITDGTNGTPRTAAETRPTNMALMPVVRYQ